MHEVVHDIGHSLSEIDCLSLISNAAFTHGFSLALWRLPNNHEKYLVVSKTHTTFSFDKTLEDLPPGFLFAPFDRNQPAHFLPADFIFNFSRGELKKTETPQQEASTTWLKNLYKQKNEFFKRTFTQSIYPDSEFLNREDFIEMVQSGIRSIENGVFEKIVPSRQIKVPLSENFDLVKTFEKLCDENPAALVSWVSIPGVGDWMGATPETLVSVHNNTIFKTVALAGTQPYLKVNNIKSVAWTQKEIEEQALVTRYIISCFKKIRLREYEEQGPKTVVAGNLMHLRTDFTVDMKATNFPQLGTVMLQLLHPTSAICGMPLEPAIHFLRQYEKYDRKFYTGYLGPVNINNAINIFVNLRCMQLLKNEALLYAGAGVTIDSNPEKEWRETEIKFNTLLKAIS